VNLTHRFRLGANFSAGLPALMLAWMIVRPVPARGLPNVKKPALAVVRWDEGAPGCTFSRTPDGRYHYGLWSDDLGVTVAVDSQELEKVHRRRELFFGVSLTVKDRGAAAVDVSAENISLEFVKHFKVIQPSLDPKDFSQKVQNDADEFDRQTAREVEKHPEEKDAKQARVRVFQRDTAELLEFLGNNTLKPTRLDSPNREATGWVLFSVDSRWIGSWKKQEEFILRVPIGGKIFEFPFKLPPREGELLLRQRE
jgi:hypothetical protein